MLVGFIKTKDGGFLILFQVFTFFLRVFEKKNFFWFFFLALFSIPVQSTTIRFPDQELSSEYVFPVFKNPKVVLNRNVSLSQRFELRVSGALRTDEPFYSPFSLSSSVAFYWNESHGIGVSGLFFVPGLSNTGESLKTKGVQNPRTRQVDSYIDVNLSPKPLMGAFLNYQFSPFYGKISITKTLNLNFALYSFLGFGALGLEHGTGPLIMTPASHFGIGQRFYFSRYFALSGGMDFLMYWGPNPVSGNILWKSGESPPPRPNYEKFEKDIFLRFLARVGLTILL